MLQSADTTMLARVVGGGGVTAVTGLIIPQLVSTTLSLSYYFKQLREFC